jgi:hypothetical protein
MTLICTLFVIVVGGDTYPVYSARYQSFEDAHVVFRNTRAVVQLNLTADAYIALSCAKPKRNEGAAAIAEDAGE